MPEEERVDEARAKRGLAGKLAARLRRGDKTEAAPVATPAPADTDQAADPLVSVIVPVYAVEQYVDEALRSILSQTYRNLEVVVVDDGSPDGSMDIVARHAARRRPVHHEQLVVVPNPPTVLSRLSFRRLA